MAKRPKIVKNEEKPKPKATVVVMTGGAALAGLPGFMEALHAFQYGESAEESDAGFRNMVGIASEPKKSDGGK